MKVHFIAVGGAAMHNLALALHYNGAEVTGSDDEINEPSRSRLDSVGLLPDKMGWYPEKLSGNIDAIILGMHAKADNPELIEAQKLGIPVYSYPEYIYEQSKTKKRIVIGGSHGKTTITAMILHVLKAMEFDFDYMVGSQLDGFDTMVRLSNAPIIVLEGDEYLSSPIDRRPKFHLYKANIALLSGIAWDHINVFPTFEQYVDQFKIFIETIDPHGSLIYYEPDPVLKSIAESSKATMHMQPYKVPDHVIVNGVTSVIFDKMDYPLNIFGKHNLANLEGARLICEHLGIERKGFLEQIKSFKGAARRMELLYNQNNYRIYRDFAHAPSKLKATLSALKEQFPDIPVTACMELHTFSSLNKEFLKQYKDSMKDADRAIVYFDPHTLSGKKMDILESEEIKKGFNRPDLVVITDKNELQRFIKNVHGNNAVLSMMSSGTFSGINILPD